MTPPTVPVPVPVALGTIAIFSDLIDPFAHVTIHRLFTARARLGLDETIRFRHHAFPIELLNASPGTRHGSDSEIPVLGPLEPDAGWQIWQGPDYHYPSSVLLAFESVQAATAQSLGVGERYDRAIRHAFWASSRPIHMHHELLAIATTIEDLDVTRLDGDLRSGKHRADLFADLVVAQSDAVSLSPHIFLSDGTNFANPGIAVHWQGGWASGFPVIDRDDPSVIDSLLEQAATLAIK
jgi:predicted DsbA family dithiol-disulfide isomerase